MKNNLVTVIVPVYNAEQFLDKCIRSIQNQKYQEIEIILVNDGSTDNSLKICENYSAKDSRIIIIDKPNGGVSAARNRGIEASRGEFCCFVDSDDWIEDTHIEAMLNEMLDADCLIEGYIREDNNDIVNCQLNSCEYNMDDLNWKEIESLFANGYIHPCWNKLYKVQLIKKFDVRFEEEIHISEDSLFCLNYLLFCNKLKISESTTYYYHIESNAISLSKKVYDDIFDIYGRVYKCLDKLLVRGNCNKSLRNQILIKTIYPQIYSSVIKILRDNEKTKEQKKQMLDKMNTIDYCENVLIGAVSVSNNKIEKMMLKLIINRRYRLLETIWRWRIK